MGRTVKPLNPPELFFAGQFWPATFCFPARPGTGQLRLFPPLRKPGERFAKKLFCEFFQMPRAFFCGAKAGVVRVGLANNSRRQVRRAPPRGTYDRRTGAQVPSRGKSLAKKRVAP
jgi:hypothetical protein